MSAPTPLLDIFKRGEAARDVKMLAAAGALAPRALEQLSILMLLNDDEDAQVRQTAQQTLDRIPVERLKNTLARSDAPTGVREFFMRRGVVPAETSPPVADDPLVDTSPVDVEAEPDVQEKERGRETVVQQIAQMGFSERLRAAVKGSREMRAILIRDPNKMIAAAVLSSPRLSEPEIEGFARMANVAEDVLRLIASNRAWIKNYGIVLGLTKNPKTPVAVSLNLLARLNDRDLAALSIDRNIPEALRTAARRKVVFGAGR